MSRQKLLLYIFFHVRVGAGAVFSGCKSVSPSHPHPYVFPTHAERFLFFRHGRYSLPCRYCSIDSSLNQQLCTTIFCYCTYLKYPQNVIMFQDLYLQTLEILPLCKTAEGLQEKCYFCCCHKLLDISKHFFPGSDLLELSNPFMFSKSKPTWENQFHCVITQITKYPFQIALNLLPCITI